MSHEQTTYKLADVTTTITGTISYYLRMDDNNRVGLDVSQVTGSIGYNIYATIDPDILNSTCSWTDVTTQFGTYPTIYGSNLLADYDGVLTPVSGLKIKVYPVTTVGINYTIWSKRI